jgi:hypothetical protein
MTTRSIITSLPDVACDVCERRLLRGEHPDVFLATGGRRIVCELCTPRAVNEGWRREADSGSLELAPSRPRRGRNLFERLRQVGRPEGDLAPTSPERLEHRRGASEFDRGPEQREREPLLEQREPEPLPYDFLDGGETGAGDLFTVPAHDRSSAGPLSAAVDPQLGGGTPAERALAVFNGSEFPRRIAGIARSLGAPAVNVQPAQDAVGEVIAIVVAWELCWYRYHVDLDEDQPAARLTAQGTELEELARGERTANTRADELGMISLSAA